MPVLVPVLVLVPYHNHKKPISDPIVEHLKGTFSEQLKIYMNVDVEVGFQNNIVIFLIG